MAIVLKKTKKTKICKQLFAVEQADLDSYIKVIKKINVKKRRLEMNHESLEYKFLESIYNKMGKSTAHVFKEANENSEISIAIYKKDGIVKIVKLNDKLEKQKLFYGDLMRLLDTAYANLSLKTEESFYKTYENFKEDLGEKLATEIFALFARKIEEELVFWKS